LLSVSEQTWRQAAFFVKLTQRGGWRQVSKVMTRGADISTLYREFTQALMDVLAEQAIGPASRGRLARARAAVKKHPEYGEHGYFLAVETAFEQWEALHTVGYIGQPSKPEQTA
jgi:hypothetical protein